MKNIYTLLIISAFFSATQFAKAQTLQYTISDAIGKEDTRITYAGHDDTSIYVLRIAKDNAKRTSGFVEGYSRATMKRNFSTPLNLPEYDGDGISLVDVKLGSGFIFIFYAYDGKDHNTHLMESEVTTKGITTGTATEMMKANEDVADYEVQQNNISKHIAVISKTKKINRMGIVKTKAGEIITYEPDVQVFVYDDKLKKISDKTATIDVKNMLITEDYFDANDNFSFAINTIQLRGGDKYAHKIAVVNSKSGVVEIQDMPDAKNNPKLKRMALAQYGMFSESSSGFVFHTSLTLNAAEVRNETAGLCIIKIDSKTATIASNQISDWTNDESVPKKKSKKNIALHFYTLKDVYVMADNSLKVFIGKFFERGYSDIPNSFFSYAQELAEVKTNAELEITDMNFIERDILAEGTYSSYLGTLNLSTDDNSYFLYNEIPSNINKKDNKRIKDFYKDIRPCYVGVDKSGEVSGSNLLSQSKAGENKSVIIPDKSFKVSDSELYTLVNISEKVYLMRIYLK